MVFLCGAGVSISADMPDFVELTQYVIDKLNVNKNTPVAKEFKAYKDNNNDNGLKVPLDQIFNSLAIDYDRSDIDYLISERLDDKNISPHDHHKWIASLSSDQKNHPQIVTTNFDHLFERVLKKTQTTQIFETPDLPNIDAEISITGLTYLHGSLNSKSNTQHSSYIISRLILDVRTLQKDGQQNLLKHCSKITPKDVINSDSSKIMQSLLEVLTSLNQEQLPPDFKQRIEKLLATT